MLDGRLIRLLVLASLLAACGDSDDGGGTDSGTDSGPPPVVDSGTPPTDSGTTPPVSVMCGSLTCTAPDYSMAAAGLDGGIDAGALGGAIDPSMFASMGVLPCCTADNACGVMSSTLFPDAGCIERDMPGTPDPACPTVDFTFNLTMPLPLSIPGTFSGCCTPDNLCGLDLGAVMANLDAFLPGLGSLTVDLGVGCVELTQADMLGGMSVVISDAGPVMSVACGDSGDGGSDDGG